MCNDNIMVEKIGGNNTWTEKQNAILASLLGKEISDEMEMSDEEIRVFCYEELLNSIVGTVRISEGNFSQVLSEFSAYCKKLRPQAEVVHIDLEGVSSQKDMLLLLKSKLWLNSEAEGMTDMSVMLGKKFVKNFQPGIYVFTGKPAISSEEDYLEDLFSDPKLSAIDEKIYYLWTDSDEVEYRSEHLWEKRPIFLK